MALPTSRNTTYAPGSQVKASDLVDIQDQIVALHTGITAGTYPTVHAAQHELHRSALHGQVVVGTNDSTRWGDLLGNWLGSVNETLQIPLDLRQKDNLHSVVARVLEGTSRIEMRVWRIDASDSTPDRVQLGSTVTSGTSGSPQNLTLSGLSEVVGSLAIFHYAEFSMVAGGGGGGTSQVFGLLASVSHPLP